ncbi:hypothetical protein JCM8097_000835 [Rhodosporidiobolus ruineniae]
MFSAAATRATLRAARKPPASLATCSPRPHQFRQLATHALPRPTVRQPSWRLLGLAGAAVASCTIWELRPDLVPTPAPLYADAPPEADKWLDPTTSTPFPTTLTSPEGVKLRLVGTGVRTVSFLSIRVYSVGFYVSEKEFEQAKTGQLAGWQGYTPERLIPPYTLPAGEPKVPVGEELMDSLVEKADAAVVIVPLRNTGLAHLRDAFTRALIARLKVPRVAEALTLETQEQTGAALIEFKSFFPPKNLVKGQPLELYYSAPNRTVFFQLRDEKTGAPEPLGTLRQPLLAKELIVSYFSDSSAPSSELLKSVAMGFSGEKRM